jgi:hypothetical protein
VRGEEVCLFRHRGRCSCSPSRQLLSCRAVDQVRMRSYVIAALLQYTLSTLSKHDRFRQRPTGDGATYIVARVRTSNLVL